MIWFFIPDYTVYSFIVLCISTLSVTEEGKRRGRRIGVWHITQRKETEPRQWEERKNNPANVESGAFNLTWSLPREKGTSGENRGEIQMYCCISAFILQKSVKEKCLNAPGSNLTAFYTPLWRGTTWDNMIIFWGCPNSFSEFALLPFRRTACKHYISRENSS